MLSISKSTVWDVEHVLVNHESERYSSDETGEYEIYVVSYPELRRKVRVSSDGGYESRWSPDGSRIFFRRSDRIMVANVLPGSDFATSAPERFVEGVDPEGMTWDVAPDGTHVIAVEKRPPARLMLIMNWFEELESKFAELE